MIEPISPFINIPCISNEGKNASYFTARKIDLEGTQTRMLSEQIAAVNFRLRKSNHTYRSDWHVAGDTTLLIVLSGTIRIVLRNGEYRDFSSGEMFIADDYLGEGISFNNKQHGHKAEVIGDQSTSKA